jgi:hypothetical protein
MGEGLAVLASSRNTVRAMATRDIYETSFDEDVRTESSANQCPECDGRVTTNAVETVCEDCGLVIDEQRIDHGPEWRAYDDEECERTGAPLTAARHDRGLSTEIGAKLMHTGTNSPVRNAGGWPGCDVSRPVGAGGPKRNGISHTGWARYAGWRVRSRSPSRSVTRRASSSGALRARVCFEADPSKPSVQRVSTVPADVTNTRFSSRMSSTPPESSPLVSPTPTEH